MSEKKETEGGAVKMVNEELEEILKLKDTFVNFVTLALDDKHLRKLGGIDARLVMSEILDYMVRYECENPEEHRESIFIGIEQKMVETEEVCWSSINHFFDDIDDETENKILTKWGETIVGDFVRAKGIPKTRLNKYQNEITDYTMKFIRKNKDYLKIHTVEEFDEVAYDHVISLLERDPVKI